MIKRPTDFLEATLSELVRERDLLDKCISRKQEVEDLQNVRE